MASFGFWKKRFHKFLDYPPAILPFLKKKLYLDFVADKYLPEYEKYHFLGYEETIDKVIENELSLVRFGDELIDMMQGIGLYYDDWHQKYDKKLADRLREVLESRDPRLMIALHWQFFTKSKKELRKDGIPPTIWTNSKVFLKGYLQEGRTYGGALCFQPKFNPQINFRKILNYFKTKHIIIMTANVERFSHIKLGKTTDFVKCPRNDSWQQYPNLFNEALSLAREKGYQKENTLFLISLASAAKVFVYDLLQEDYQAWDTGQFFDLAFKQIKKESSDL
jgi:hypothetical protein